MDAQKHPTRIVIIGGGFGGVKCAQTLRRHLKPADCEIVLFDTENHLVFSPLLAEVAGSLLHADAVAAPLRQLLPTVLCRRERVQQIDFERRLIRYDAGGSSSETLEYDQVVIACGRTVDMTRIPGMADHSMPLSRVGDALQLRSRIIQQLEKADVTSDPERRRRGVSFIIAGGGFTGIEAAGEINDFVRESLRFYPHIPEEDIRVTLIHSHDQILPEVSPPLRDFARSKMEERGIHFILNARVAMVTAEGVRLSDGATVHGAVVVGAMGSAPTPLLLSLDTALERGFLRTEPDLRLQGKTNAWAIGDCARIINAFDHQPSPTTGQFAERQGRQAADNILRSLRGEPTRPFYYRSLGQLCSIGGRRAVAEIYGHRLSGFWAWFVWRGVYLFKMPGWPRRIKIGIEWAWDLIFGRDLTSIAPELTQRFSSAYYSAGDMIFQKGEPATHLYAIESGEVEVLEDDRVIALYTAGDFFGERSLMEKRPHQRSARARTALHVVVMGSEVFSQLSDALGPLKQLIVQTAEQRETDALRRFPELRRELRQTPIAHLMESLPDTSLRIDQTFGEALTLFRKAESRYAVVLDEQERLTGIVGLTDLFRAAAQGASWTTPLREFMKAHPACVALDDSPERAIDILRERMLKWLPVVNDARDRRFVGWIRAQKLLEQAFKGASYADQKS